MKAALDYANSHNLIPGVTFSYATSTVINSAVLAGYKPSGHAWRRWRLLFPEQWKYQRNSHQNFVAGGGAYLGICAGAYAGAAGVDGMYDSWGVAPT